MCWIHNFKMPKLDIAKNLTNMSDERKTLLLDKKKQISKSLMPKKIDNFEVLIRTYSVANQTSPQY